MFCKMLHECSLLAFSVDKIAESQKYGFAQWSKCCTFLDTFLKSCGSNLPCYLGQGNNKVDFLVSNCYNSKIARYSKTSIPVYVFQNASRLFTIGFFVNKIAEIQNMWFCSIEKMLYILRQIFKILWY
jgi:hypothetical protein